MSKVFLGVGHGGNDPGAAKYVVEKDVNLTMALACRDYLELHGVKVKMSRTRDENDPVSEEVKECNAFNPDLAIDIHNNAGGGDGFEVLHSINGGTGKMLASNIEAEVKKIGQNSRGLKTKKNSSGTDYFAFIRSTKCPAVICEGIFTDNAKDVKIADTKKEQEAFGIAYAKGILKTLGISETEKSQENQGISKAENKTVAAENKAETTEQLVKVKVAALNIRAGASAKSKIVGQITDEGVYTIVETKNGWGKLKSGKGWIKLSYTTKV